jgi:hypothetical protein
MELEKRGTGAGEGVKEKWGMMVRVEGGNWEDKRK